MLSVPLDTGAPIDTKPQIADVQPLPDGLSYPHDVVVAATVPCMQQVVANGYASDKASCATWKLKLNEPYNSQLAVPYTSQTACVALIDCYVANSSTCTNWYSQACGDCLSVLPVAVQDWQPAMDLIAPFCPTFFISP